MSPRSGQVFHGSPASVPVRVRLTGGEIASFTSTKLTRDQGHIHLFVNGNLMSMVFKSSRELDLPRGTTA